MHPAWNFVDRLPNGRWRCHECGKHFQITKNTVQRIRSHLVGPMGNHIVFCPDLNAQRRMQFQQLFDEVAAMGLRAYNAMVGGGVAAHGAVGGGGVAAHGAVGGDGVAAAVAEPQGLELAGAAPVAGALEGDFGNNNFLMAEDLLNEMEEFLDNLLVGQPIDEGIVENEINAGGELAEPMFEGLEPMGGGPEQPMFEGPGPMGGGPEHIPELQPAELFLFMRNRVKWVLDQALERHQLMREAESNMNKLLVEFVYVFGGEPTLSMERAQAIQAIIQQVRLSFNF